jgi:hypothetical protein
MSFSCEKKGHCKDKGKVSTYYSEDYVDSNGSFLGVHASDLQELSFHFYYENGKNEKFKFVGVHNGEYVYHEGTYSKSGHSVYFYPEDSSHPNYSGEFSLDGKTLTIDYPGNDEDRYIVTFIGK